VNKQVELDSVEYTCLGSECLVSRVEQQASNNVNMILLGGHVQGRESILRIQHAHITTFIQKLDVIGVPVE